MDSLLRDLRLAVRIAVRNPGFSLIVILTFGLGIGLTTTVFSIVNGVIYKGLPFEDPERIVAVGRTNPQRNMPIMGVSIHDLADWQEEQTVFEALGALSGGPVNLGTEEGRPVRLTGGLFTPEIFEVLRVQPIFGRAFIEEDARPGAEPVILLGYEVWQEQFDGAEDVVGRTVRANGEIRTVIGIMPEGFKFPNLEQVWLPLDVDPSRSLRGEGPAYQGIARLGAGVSVEEARTQIAGIARRIEQAYPEINEGIGGDVHSFTEQLGGQIFQLLYTMLGAVLAVMLIACVNVANLLIARAATRSREMAVRTALGAGRARVVRQLLSEVLLLALFGGILGFGLGTAGIEWFKRVIEVNPPPAWIRFDHDYRVVLFALGVTVLAAVISGVFPALQATGSKVGDALKDQARGSSSFRVNRLTGGLVTAEVALSCCLLVAAGLMIKSVTQLRTVELPFTTENVFTARINLPAVDYPDTASRVAFYDQLLERVDGIPGVEAATLSDGLPAAGNGMRAFQIEGRDYVAGEDFPQAREGIVTPGYFRTFAAEVLRGRAFQVSDRAGALPVCIVNETFARNFLDGDALGKRMRKGVPGTDLREAGLQWLTVVGVVPDMRMEGIGNNEASPAGFYIPIGQSDVGSTVVIALRTRQAPMSKTQDVRAAVTSIDPNLPIFQVLDMEGVIARQTFFYTIFGKLFMAFGFAALFLAGVGLYGVMSFAVAQRTQEMGVRMAHGAQGRQLIALVMKRGAAQVGIGMGIGLVLAVLVAGQVQFLLFEVNARDPGVFGLVLGTLAAAGFLATFIPARRVTKVDPVTALTPV
ncbi:ABC transporter permease [Gemmatimonadota bacterium]